MKSFFALAGGLYLFGVVPVEAQPVVKEVVYQTGFEHAEGFTNSLTLIGQNGWVGDGSGGNGVVEEFFPGYGQQAFVGFTAPAETNEVLNVWRPVNVAPVDLSAPVLRFSVVMQVADSTHERQDDFRWSVYNTNGHRLFTLDFDNQTKTINYALDDTTFVSSGSGFANEGVYDLVILMNFARNHWTALLNGFVVVNSKPITTLGHPLNLGDIDAVWAIRTPGQPGDNFMLFDNYQIAVLDSPAIPAVLEPIGHVEGLFRFQFFGELGVTYAIDVSSDLRDWFNLGEDYPGGAFPFEDTTSAEEPFSFYRARILIPGTPGSQSR